jgi:anaerobic selenocysteine-containing dehydrogenase
MLTAYENFYASTCRQCAAGCGMLVRVIEGRAKKAEGNPAHPVNRGKLCARGQASVQEQYHPDRLRGPMQRSAERGSGVFSPILWDTALDQVAGRLRDLQLAGQGSRVAFLTAPPRGQQALLLGRFAQMSGAEWHQLESLSEAPLREAVRRIFGQEMLPEFDVEHARYVLSFGADFLSTWLSPVHYGVEYGIFRQGSYQANQFQPRQASTRPRGFLVQVEPRFSMTAANADQWVPVRPGQEGRLALSIAQAMLSQGLADGSAAAAFGDLHTLDAYLPERVAQDTGVGPDRIRQLALDLATQRPSLVLGGGPAGASTNGTETLTAILALNILLGNLGQPGGLYFNPPPPIQDLSNPAQPDNFTTWQQLAERIRAGEFEVVLVHGANPIFELPGLRFEDALAHAPLVVSFSSFLDETTAHADLVLPVNLPLEDWGDDLANPGPGYPVLTLQQPLLQPFFDTRAFGDLLLQLVARLGGELQQAFPWTTYKDVVRDGAHQLQQLNRGSVQDAEFERFWVKLLQQGGWWDPSWPAQAAPMPDRSAAVIQQLASSFPAPQSAGDSQEFPFQLLVYAHNTLGAGESAHLPWLQAAPDPITSVVWQAWVEVNPVVATRLELREGSIVTLESPQGRVDLPVYINPAAPPDVLAVPLGQGHTNFGRWAERRGVNPMSLIAPLTDVATGSLAYAATRVRLTSTGRQIALPKFEGNVPPFQIPDDQVIQVTSA